MNYIEYLYKGYIVVIISYYIPILFKSSLRQPTFKEILLIGLVATISLIIIDEYTIQKE